MKYFFTLGNHPELSIAEIKSLFSKQKMTYQSVLETEEVFIFETEEKIEPTIIDLLGGAIRFGEVFDFAIDPQDIYAKTIKVLPEDSKIYFGVSFYNKEKFKSKDLGFKIKEKISSNSRSCRFVTSKENPLSSVIVKKNRLVTARGFELNVMFDNNNIYLGRTLSVQDFRKYSQIDFGRPGRDDVSGMLPPKVAQVMVNLTEKSDKSVILDPFCGSGTVLQMAAMNGYKKLLASDNSEKAVRDTEENNEWLQDKFELSYSLKTTMTPVEELSKSVKGKTIDAVVTEPYMGPALRGNESPETIRQTIDELTQLYKKAFDEFTKVMKPDGVIIFVFPEYVIKEKHFHFDIENIIPRTFKVKGHWQYSRENQKVIRNIYKITTK